MKTRENSFFGIHFDFHAQEGQTVGTDFRPEVVAELLDRVKPDYVQCDTKGHYGYSSYPTKIGTPPTAMEHDVLKMWRQLTKERDIALYAHHSGLFDVVAAQKYPHWAVVNADGTVSNAYMSPFGPYADLTVLEKDGKLLVNIVNTAGPGGLSQVRSYNEVPKIGPLTVRIQKDNIAKITEMPAGRELPFRQWDGYTEFTLESVHVHTTAVIEFQ